MAAQTQNRCLYEILQLPRDCTPEQIRSSYRRLALQLHPDKNPNSSPDAFQSLQNAYEILSDPKERAFYDSHRSQILFSNPSSSSKSSSLFDVDDLVPYFSNSAFSGYGSTGKGFYKVYADVFDKIYSQELLFVKEMGLDRDLVRDAPMFGNLESEYEQWSAFYGYWLGFVTVLDFGWVDEYDASLGVNRKSRRLMEEENKKKRKKAKREYIDLVRDLAAFVKKRDKRVIDMQVKKALAEEKRKEEERMRKKEEMMRKIERAKVYEEPEWAKADEIVDEDDDEVDMGKKREEFYCVACNKKFKSDKQWKNHEQSKKHKEKVAELRVSFRKEEALVKEEDSEDEEVYFEPENTKNAVKELCEELNDDLNLNDENVETEDFDDAEEGTNSDDEASVLEAMLSDRKSKQNIFANLDDFVDILNQDGSFDNEKEIYASHDSQKNCNRSKRRGDNFDGISEYIKEEIDARVKNEDEALNQEELNGEAKNVDIPNEKDVVEEGKETLTSIEGTSAKGKGNIAAGKKSKKQQADARGSIKKDTNTSKSKGKKQKGSAKSSSNACDTCGENFETRNKLFAHLGNTGHASLKVR